MKFPIGIQDFRTIREGGYAYVDKTERIYGVVDYGKYFFLSRPRRFGKSLLLSTMNELYSGSEELFEGLWIHDNWDFAAEKRPVIWLKFASSGFQTEGLERGIHRMLDEVAKQYDVVLTETGYSAKFRELIMVLGVEKGVVLLIDEYDKPIIDNIGRSEKIEEHKNILKNFYSVLKDSDPYLRLVFITGVSAFSKVSIFSDLNNLRNLTLDRLAFNLVGITQKELNRDFGAIMQNVDAAKVKEWYNGYSWGGAERVYNPFSLLSFLATEQFHPFWYQTGTPTFLMEHLRNQKEYDLENMRVPLHDLINFDANNLKTTPVLFQTGYLTIKEYNEQFQYFLLDYPNREVRQAFDSQLLEAYLYENDTSFGRILDLMEAFHDNDVTTVIDAINATFAELPYEHWRRDDEHFFHAIIHLTFRLIGIHIRSEVHTARGRCDAIVEAGDYIYALEFKLNANARVALDQIREKGYLEPYADRPEQKVALGISFDSESKQVGDWAVEEY